MIPDTARKAPLMTEHSTLPQDAGPVGVLAEVAAERARQIAKGYDAAHDDGYADSDALSHHAAHAIDSMLYTMWVIRPDRRSEIISGIALAVAEVERMDRAALAGPAS